MDLLGNIPYLFKSKKYIFPMLMLLKIGCSLESKAEKFIGWRKLSFQPFQMEKCNHPLVTCTVESSKLNNYSLLIR